VLKVELHSHTADDPSDPIPYSTAELIDRAAELGYDALAVTLHNRQLDVASLRPYAAERGVTLIPGVERTIQGKHVLLLNFRRGAEEVQTFDDLRRLRQRESGLVVAPHPFFPHPSCLRGLMNRHDDLFDAVEYHALHTRAVNFNDAAARWARERGLPMVGNGDVHALWQMGTTYSLVDAEREPDAICAAIRAGAVTVEARPLSTREAAASIADFMGLIVARTLSGQSPVSAAPRRLFDEVAGG
jgi:predicted metal-dependent phosphoesterase TrpH